MKKKTNVRTLIRQIVREEVAMAIHEVITELKQSPQQVSQPKPKKKVVEKKQYTKNSVLNDILNETTLEDEWKTMGQGTYTSDRMNEVMSSQYSDLVDDNPNGNLAAEMGINPEAPGMDFLKKDYRSLMKKIDEKSKQKRGM